MESPPHCLNKNFSLAGDPTVTIFHRFNLLSPQEDITLEVYLVKPETMNLKKHIKLVSQEVSLYLKKKVLNSEHMVRVSCMISAAD